MKTSDFDYDLPPELIAQEPAAERDGCRLLVMNRVTGEVEDRVFRDIVDYLTPNDLLVANETRVMPARLLGAKRGTGGAAEVFLLRQHGTPTDVYKRQDVEFSNDVMRAKRAASTPAHDRRHSTARRGNMGMVASTSGRCV